MKYLATYWNNGDLTRHVEIYDTKEDAAQAECTATCHYLHKQVVEVNDEDLDREIEYYTCWSS